MANGSGQRKLYWKQIVITNKAVEAMICALHEPDVGHEGESQPGTILNIVQKGFMKGCYDSHRGEGDGLLHALRLR